MRKVPSVLFVVNIILVLSALFVTLPTLNYAEDISFLVSLCLTPFLAFSMVALGSVNPNIYQNRAWKIFLMSILLSALFAFIIIFFAEMNGGDQTYRNQKIITFSLLILSLLFSLFVFIKRYRVTEDAGSNS